MYVVGQGNSWIHKIQEDRFSLCQSKWHQESSVSYRQATRQRCVRAWAKCHLRQQWKRPSQWWMWCSVGQWYSGEGVASYSLVCDVLTPMSNAALRELFEVLPKVFKHNTAPAMLMLGTACMTFHYGIVLSTEKCFPVPLASGCSGTGKTLALRCALALYGAHNKHVYQHCTLQYYTSWCSESSIPFGIDDPSHSKELGELMLSVFNGTMTGNITARKP